MAPKVIESTVYDIYIGSIRLGLIPLLQYIITYTYMHTYIYSTSNSLWRQVITKQELILLIINLITKPTIVNSVIWKFHSTKLKLSLSCGDKVIPLSLIHLYLNISQRKYWYFCQNAQISALDTIRYKLGFYICLTLMNDFICINEYISWHHKTLQTHMK